MSNPDMRTFMHMTTTALCPVRSLCTCVAEHKVQHVEVLALEDVPVAALGVRVAVHDGGGGSAEQDHVDPLGQAGPWEVPPGGEAQGPRLQGTCQAVVGQLHATGLLLCQNGKAPRPGRASQ